MKIPPLLIIALILHPLVSHAAPSAPAGLNAVPLSNELGLHLNEYSFSWSADGQKAYQVQVASDERKLDADVGDLWDSGRRSRMQQTDIRCLGSAFADGATVWWKVRIWNGAKEASAWSRPARLEVPPSGGPAKREARNRVVLLGGTMISRMDNHGFLETAITVAWPQHDISFRNLGWPGDDVFGTARSEFGSAQNTRSWMPPKGQRGFGFEKLKEQLAEAQPTTLVVGYGEEAAYADSEEKMKNFELGYRNLIEELEGTGAKLVLLAPIMQYRHGSILPDPAERNKRLVQAGQFIMALAKTRGHTGIAPHSAGWFGKPGDEGITNPYFENGVHLNERGYLRLARMLSHELALPEAEAEPSRQEHVEKTTLGVRYDATRDRLPLPVSVDRNVQESQSESGHWVDGVQVQNHLIGNVAVQATGPDFDQSERLREVINEKNRFHRYKLNPINKAYIFLFRRHEMGHLAYELDDLAELIEGREQVIAKLRVPQTRRHEIIKARDWTPPRDYPDHEVPQDIPTPDVAAELEAFTVADGFEVSLFASDPMIANPINLNWDSRGRAWVATSSTYPHIKPGRIPNDRIVILEDTDRDGRADKSTVFAEGLTVPHSVMPVKGGAYVCSTTELLFLADNDGDDVADEKRVVFSGFGNADVHHMIHGLRWAPWGDLFFTQSIYINSFVETAHGSRRLNGSGIWRFRPELEKLDVFARGMTNPWGFALNDWGQAFATDGAGGAGPHDVFPGSAFGTAVGAPRVLRGLLPGKPKNTAAEFVSGRHLPAAWQGSLLANDFRANRTVRYELQESGSGFTANEVETVLASSHRSFRPVDLKMGPDGAVYVVDWYNSIIDHGEVDFYHPARDKSHGRIWRMTAKNRTLVDPPVIAEATIEELLEHLKAPEQYTRMRANRELASRPRQGLMKPVTKWLAGLDRSDPDYERHRLEGLWLLMAHRAAPPRLAEEILSSPHPLARAAAAKAIGNWDSRLGSLPQLELLAGAVEDEHPRVRLEAVSALRGIGSLAAANLALRALDYEVDGNLDFALEMTVRDTRDEWLPAMRAGKVVFDGDARRMAYALKKADDSRAIEALLATVKGGGLGQEDKSNAVTMIAALGTAADLDAILSLVRQEPDLLEALAEGATANAAIPEAGATVARFLTSEPPSVRIAAARLAGRWKVAAAEDLLVRNATAAGSTPERLAMTSALASLGSIDSLRALWTSKDHAQVRAAAIAAYAGVNPEKAARPAAEVLRELSDPVEAEMIFDAFLSRQDGPGCLTAALGGLELRQQTALAGVRAAESSGRDVGNLVAALTKAGKLKRVAQNLSQEERRGLLEEAGSKGSAERGSAVFHRAETACAVCHLVNGKGGKLGPDLSTVGSYMTPESMLESLLNPSTDIKQGYETVIVTRKNQSVVSGLLQRKTDTAVLVRDPTGKVVSISNDDIATIDTSPVSLMPPGLTASLRHDELVDLLAYLSSLGRRK